MNRNSSNYFAYKKNKIQSTVEVPKKTISKLNFLFQLFMVTFIIMFIIIVVSIMKYSSKMDIEYTKGELPFNNIEAVNSNPSPSYSLMGEDEQRKIDKRLLLIQQEENAPSEAKVLTNDKRNPQVIDPIHIEKNKKIEKAEKQKAIQAEIDKKAPTLLDEIKNYSKKTEQSELNADKNITILSKILVGRYSTFEEAQKVQNEIKAQDAKLTPFVRKVGEAFSVQMGSYQDFNMAKTQAQYLKSKGFDVWIYQQ